MLTLFFWSLRTLYMTLFPQVKVDLMASAIKGTFRVDNANKTSGTLRGTSGADVNVFSIKFEFHSLSSGALSFDFG